MKNKWSDNQSTPKSITAKIDSAKLKRGLKRRLQANKVSYLYDCSVPNTLLLEGILSHQPASKNPIIRQVAKKTLSPFVVYLDDPAPINQLENAQQVMLNFLLPEEYLLGPELEAVDDLTLCAEDLHDQLREDLTIKQPLWPRLCLAIPSLKNNPGVKAELFSHPKPLLNQFPISELNPPEPTPDLSEYLELPEEEEMEYLSENDTEPEIITLDDLEQVAQHKKPHFLGLPMGWQRALGVFVLVSFVFVLPLHAMNLVNDLKTAKNKAENQGNHALNLLGNGAQAALIKNPSAAADAFSNAGQSFSSAGQTIDELGAATNLILSTLPISKKTFKSNKHLVEAGTKISLAAERISEGFLALEKEITPTPTSRLKLLSTYLFAAIPYLTEAQNALNKVDPTVIPIDNQETFTNLTAQLPIITQSLKEFIELSTVAQEILGSEGTKRYLAIFQNNTELRPTGGFMGSFAEIKVNNGEIVNLSVPGGGTYDLQGSLRDLVIAPEPLQLISAQWQFQDANWFPDFPTSARQIIDFYSASGGPTVDGVIAINATYVADLLNLLGAVEMPEYSRTINAENFITEAQKIVELEYDRQENKPKAFIGDLAPKLLERALEKTAEDFLVVLDHVAYGLNTRDIQLFFTTDDLEEEILNLGWGGDLKWTDGDYLMVVDTNLGGGKTDGVIEQKVNLEVEIDQTGLITNTVTIARSHYGERGALFTGVNNVDYLRLYVPKGAKLVSASGFSIPDESLFEKPEDTWRIDDDIFYSQESYSVDQQSQTHIYNENGKTVFGNWVQTMPGKTSIATFKYQLPFGIENLKQTDSFFDKIKDFIGLTSTNRYTLTIQKQPGVLDRTTTVKISPPENINTLWSSHDLNGTHFTNTQDSFLGVLFEYE
ncbi:DUF4012 domain-containing protein [Patescibacteria group bacterium]